MQEQETLQKLYSIVDYELKATVWLHQFIDKIGDDNNYFKDHERERLYFRVWLLSLNSYISSLSLAIADINSASAVCRCALEYSTILLLLWKNKNLHKEILIFTDMYYDFNDRKDKQVYLDYLNEKSGTVKKSKMPTGYDMFGWLDAIRNTSGAYTFKAATECLIKHENNVNAIYQNYKSLCSFVHPTHIYGDYKKEQTLSNYLDIVNEILIHYVNTLIDNLQIENVELAEMKSYLYQTANFIAELKSEDFLRKY